TDEKGEWRAFLLPIGEYDVVATVDGYISSSAKGIRIGIGGNQRQDLSLTPIKESGAVVEVLGSASSADKSDTKSAVNYSAENLQTLATVGGDRGFLGALSVAPGVVSETPNGNTAIIRGGTINATNFTVNGADVKNQLSGQVENAWYVQDNIEDVQVVLSPLNARYGRAAGGSVNVVTKTGGNDFSGSIRSSFNRQSWNANSALFPVTYTDSLQRTWDLVVSGPIVKDKLWFNVASILSPKSANGQSFNWGGIGWRDPRAVYPTQNANIDAVTATDLTTGVPLPGSKVPAGYVFGFPQAGAQFTQNTTSNYVEAKITGAITPDHILEYAFMRSSKTTTNADPNNDLWHSVRVQSLGDLKDDRKIDGLTYRGTLTSSLFLEARFTANEDKITKPQGDTKYAGGKEAVFQHGLGITSGVPYTTAAQDAAGANAYGYQPFGPWVSPNPSKQKSTSYNVDLKWIKEFGLGSHEFDFGLDGYTTKYDNNADFNTTDLGSNNRQYVIGGYYQQATDPTALLFPVIAYTGPTALNRQPETAWNKWTMGLAPTMIQYTGPAGGSIDTTMQALYANDQWTLNSHWNVMMGLRFESQKIDDSNGAELIKSNTVSPRLQVRYDIKGDSRNLITFTAARFQGDLPQSFIAAFATHPQNSGVYKGFNNINGTPLPAPGSATDNGNYGVRFVDWATIENPNNYGILINQFDNSKTNVVDSGLKPPAMDEFTLGFSKSYLDGSSVSITYVNRSWSNLWAIGYDYAPNQVVTITPDASYGIQKHFFNSNALTRKYNGLELAWDIKTKTIWSLNGSWSYSRLTGNDEQGDDPTGNSTIMQTNPTPLFYNAQFLNSKGVPTSVYAPDGRLLNDLTNRIRLGATATIPFGKGGQVTLNWMAHYVTGQPYGSVNFGNSSGIDLSGWGLSDIHAGANNTTVAGSRTILGYAGGRRPFEQNGLAGVDFRAAFKLPLPLWKLQLFGDVTISNFFNHMDKGYNTSFNTVYDPSNPAVSPTINLPANFGAPGANGDPRQYTAPRTVLASLGARF
ncbi:MAG TPA: TonB-dependent receptor, partial [Geothrix sp.]|nr:TonB-dependent receptor [Geothrix sp.]